MGHRRYTVVCPKCGARVRQLCSDLRHRPPKPMKIEHAERIQLEMRDQR